MMLEVVEVQAALLQLVDRYFGFALSFNVPVEVELPSRDGLGQGAVLVTKRDTKLDDL